MTRGCNAYGACRVVGSLLSAVVIFPTLTGSPAHAYFGLREAWSPHAAMAPGALPATFRSVSVDGSGVVYVLNGDLVERYTRAGRFLGSWSARSAVPSGAAIHDMAVGRHGTVYVSVPTDSRVLRFTATGTRLDGWTLPDPRALAVGPREDLFVADASGVERIGPDGRRLAAWWPGVKPGFVAVGPSGEVYVSWLRQDRRATAGILKFDANGRRLARVGAMGSRLGQFRIAGAFRMTVDPRGRLWVSEGAYRALQFDSHGRFVRACGGPRPGGPSILHPGSLAAGPGGDLYVEEGVRVRRLGETVPPAIPCGAPRISHVTLRSTAFRRSSTPRAGDHGSRVLLTLDRPASVRVSFARGSLPEGSITVQRGAGRVGIRVSGWVGKRALSPGRHTMTITGADRSGNRSRVLTFAVTLLG